MANRGTEAMDVVVLGPHPDDAELGCGGTILKLTAAGRRVAVVDLTRGEMGSLGDPQTRAAECAAASARLGLTERRNLGLPDARLRDDETALRALIEALRALRPSILIAPLERDVHPDHAATGALASRAFFTAGLAALWPELGAAHRPKLFLRYPLHHELPVATLCVDTSGQADAKLEALRCYASQLPGGDRRHMVGLDIVERARARDAFYGARAACQAAEPFWLDGPLRVDDLTALL